MIPGGRGLFRRSTHTYTKYDTVSSILPINVAKPLPGLYQHYKNGDRYNVLECVLHTETSEDMVLYKQAIIPEVSTPRGFVQPTNRFMGTVVHNGNEVPRFKRVPDSIPTPHPTSFFYPKTKDDVFFTIHVINCYVLFFYAYAKTLEFWVFPLIFG